MNNLVDQKSYVDGKIAGLSKILPTLKVVKNDAVDLVNTINNISQSSEKISGKIRTLDTARVRAIYYYRCFICYCFCM